VRGVVARPGLVERLGVPARVTMLSVVAALRDDPAWP
jgi:hypothetical protein